MKTYRWISLVLAIVLMASAMIACGEDEEKQFDEEMASQLQAALEAAVDSQDTHFPGALLYVSGPQLGTWSGAAGLGNIEADTSMRPDDKFRAGSLTKPMVSVVILQLVEEGRLSLDDPMTAVLPESITAKFADSDQITVRMLLNHTSGIAEWVNDAVYAEALTNPEKVWEVDEFLDIAAAQEPDFPPGEGWAYTNTDYTLLGLVIEQATGRSWRAEIRERVVEPLDLENTLLPEPGDLSIPGNHAHGYFFYEGQVFDVSYVDPSMAGAAGGHALVTTAADLGRFLDAVLAGELFQNSGTLDEMLAYVDAAEGFEPWAVGYGLGLEVFEFPNGVKGLGHTGGTAGYIAYVVHLPAQDITIAGSWNFQEYFEMYLTLLEVLVPGYTAPEPTPTPAGNVYQDPEGRFSMTLVGDWTPVETDGTYARFAYADMDLAMSLAIIEASDAEGDLPVAVQSIGVDPASLTETYRGNWNRWSVFYYDTAAGEGVTVLGQVQDGIGYYIVATGDAAITSNPPEDVMKTIGGFALAGETVLPSTVPEFESYVNDIVGLRPPALSIAIATTDDVIYAQGFGMADRPEGMQAASDTVYFWGSITKTVTATAIMQLREQGLVDLDAPVSEYLDYVPAQYGITVWNLLTHSSGLPEPDDWLPKHLRLEGQPLPDFDAMDREYYAELTDLMFEPGTQSAYANPDFVTLGQIVAAVSGQSYVEYVREHILVPLGMDTTDFEYSTETILANAAAPATSLSNREAMISIIDDARGLGDAATFFRETDEDTAWMSHFIVGEAAGGGLMGPPTEMVRYAQMLLNGGELDGVRILSSASVEFLKQEQVSTSGEPLGFGMAWLIRDDPEHPYIEHGGGGEGVDALLRVYPQDGFAIALQANSGGYSRQDVMNAAANVVLSMLGG